MNDLSQLRALQAARQDLRQLWREVELFSLRSRVIDSSDERSAPISAVGSGFKRLAESVGIDISALDPLLTTLTDPGGADAAMAELKAAFKARDEEIEAELATHPAGIEKARSWLGVLVARDEPQDTDFEAHVYLGQAVSPEQITEIAGQSRAEWRDQMARPDRHVAEFPNMFWTSLDFQDLYDALARYRFYEAFNLGEFDAVSNDIKAFVGRVLLEAAGAMEPFGGAPWPNPEARHAAETLFLTSRSERITTELADVISLVLRGLGRFQSDDGSWPSPRGQRQSDAGVTTVPADTLGTAAAAIAIQKLSPSEDLRERATKAVDWLLTVQDADGHWQAWGHDSSSSEYPILQTALSLEAIARNGRFDVQSATERGVAWLLGEQAAEGIWEENSLPNPLLSVVVVEALERIEAPVMDRSPAVETARQLILRGERLSREDSLEARQLAVIAVHTGIEAILYAALESMGTKVIENNRTIGLRSALGKVQNALQATGTLARGETLPQRGSVDRLAYLRDEVVHKGLAVSRADISNHIGDSKKLCSFVSTAILSEDLFPGVSHAPED